MNTKNDMWDGIAIHACDVELPPRVGTIERVGIEFRKDEDGSQLLEHNGSISRNIVLDISLPGVTDTWENGVKVQKMRLGSKTWMQFLDKLDKAGFQLAVSPTELEGETFEFEVEERTWTTKEGTAARWVLDWPKAHLPPQ